jgi:hypothetical protein
MAALITGKLPNNRYKFAFTSEDGKVVCEISVARPPGPPDMRKEAEKKEEALRKLKRLAKALDAAIVNADK